MSDRTTNAANDRSDVEQLQRMNKEWADALVRKDRVTLDRIMADDFIFTYPMDGDSKAQFIEDVESGALQVEYLGRTRVEVNVFGHTGVLTAFDDAKWRYKGHEILGCYRIIHVYSRRGGEWQLVAIQACPVGAK